MMTNLPILAEITLQWSIWLGLYFLILRHRTFFGVNRFYLLGTLLIGIAIPFFHSFHSLAQNSGFVISLPEILVTTEAITPVNTLASKNTTNWISVIYITGVIMSFVWFIINLTRLLYSISHLRKQKLEKNWLVELPKKTAPFSFFNYIFVFQKEAYDKEEWDQILLHEQTHGRLLHSLDILLLEILKIIFWWNPLIYIYKFMLRDIHEFQADNATIQNHNKKEYSRLLFKHTQSGMQVLLTSNFISSQLKKRIKMLTNKRSNSTDKFRYLLTLPLIILLFFVSCQESDPNSIQETVTTAKKTELSERIKDLAETVKGKELTEESKADFQQKVQEIASDMAELQENGTKPNTSATFDEDGNKTFKKVEEMPIFEGCEGESGQGKLDKCSEKALLNFIYSNIKYPEIARKNGIQGRVIIKFIINEKGKVEQVKNLKGPGGGTGEEAIRVIQIMNEKVTWTPGRHNNKPVKVEYLLPIVFKLQQ